MSKFCGESRGCHEAPLSKPVEISQRLFDYPPAGNESNAHETFIGGWPLPVTVADHAFDLLSFADGGF